jgi:hypothetical protein
VGTLVNNEVVVFILAYNHNGRDVLGGMIVDNLVGIMALSVLDAMILMRVGVLNMW